MRLGACGFLKVTFSSGGEGAVTAPPMVHSEAGRSEAEPGGDISLGTRLWLQPVDYHKRLPEARMLFSCRRMSRASPEGPPDPLRPKHEHSGTAAQVRHFSEPQQPLWEKNLRRPLSCGSPKAAGGITDKQAFGQK